MNMTNTPINAVVIDDDENARETLRSMLEKYCPHVRIMGEAEAVEPGLALIRSKQPQLIFLDVEMPPQTGFDLLKRLDAIDAEIIFTTAHDHYAILAIKVSALDYLLKPIDREELIAAVSKLSNQPAKVNRDILELLRQQLDSKQQYAERLVIPSLKGYEIIRANEIQYCEGDGNYTTFYLVGRTPLVASKILKEFERLLSPGAFIRVHAKYLVNIDFVKRYQKGRGGTLVMADGRSIEVSHSKKQYLLDALSR
jgi:two-component system LytT family response regulator